MNKKSKMAPIILVLFLIIVLVGATIAFVSLNKSNKNDSSDVTALSETSKQESSASESSVESYPTPSLEESSEPSESAASETNELSDSTADEKIATFGKMGEAYTLHGHFYNQGEDISSDEITDGFFEGNMNVTVNEANVLDYSNEYFYSNEGLNESVNDIKSLYNDVKILQVKLTLDNIDAYQMSNVQYEFNATIFKLGIYEDLIPADTSSVDYVKPSAYFYYPEFAFEPHGEDASYYHFELNLGESKDFTFYFIIDGDYVNQKDPFLAISSGRDTNFGVLLTDITYE